MTPEEQALREELTSLKSNADQFFSVAFGTFVLLMQAGFGLLEAGSVRTKNTINILMKNVLDLFIGSLAYYFVGYSFSFGEPGNAFIGHSQFFATNLVSPTVNGTQAEGTVAPSAYYASWFFLCVFAATAATIVSGALAERTEFVAYMIYSFFLTAFIYPVVAHWAWGNTGWLKTGAGTGLSYRDFAGSGAVHMLSGMAALVGAIFLGPRIGRFNDDGSVNEMPGHSVTMAAFGAFILIVGFLVFNGGSLLSISNPGDGLKVSMATVNTIIAGSSSGLTTMCLNKLIYALKGKEHYWSLLITINGSLTGMVVTCASCADIYPWAAFVFGVIGGFTYIAWNRFMLWIKVDDPLDAVAVHLGGGIAGIILGPIFSINGLSPEVGGIIYGGHPEAFRNLGWNIVGGLTIAAWTAGTCTILFGSMKFLGILRVSREVELAGLDGREHGQEAYPLASYYEPALQNSGGKSGVGNDRCPNTVIDNPNAEDHKDE